MPIFKSQIIFIHDKKKLFSLVKKMKNVLLDYLISVGVNGCLHDKYLEGEYTFENFLKSMWIEWVVPV